MEGAFALTPAEKAAGAPYAEEDGGDVGDDAAGEVVVAAEEAGMHGSVQALAEAIVQNVASSLATIVMCNVRDDQGVAGSSRSVHDGLEGVHGDHRRVESGHSGVPQNDCKAATCRSSEEEFLVGHYHSDSYAVEVRHGSGLQEGLRANKSEERAAQGAERKGDSLAMDDGGLLLAVWARKPPSSEEE
jgi:hypothetical protein